MDTVVEDLPTQIRKQQSDNEQAQQLFDQMSMSDENPFENLQLSSEAVPPPQQSQQQENKQEEIVDFREMMRKSKKQKKKEKRKNKLKAAKNKQEASRKQNINTNIINESNKKRIKKMVMDSEDQQEHQQQVKQKSSQKRIKQRRNSESQGDLQKGSQESAQYSSEQQLSSQSEKNQDNGQQGQQGRPKRKKLGRKSRMQRILQKQGFDLKQLGNDGEANYQLNESIDDSDDSFSSTQKKKKRSNKKVKRQKKQKKPQLSNQQFLSKLKEIGCEDQVEQNESQRYNYDSGIEELTKLRPKKQAKNTIKVQNKLFGNLEMEIEEQINSQQKNQLPQQQVPIEKLQLQFKPKSSSSRAGSFLSKVQTIKKHRGLEADIDQAQFDKLTKQKAIKSIHQLATKIQNQIEDNEQIDIQIKAPVIAKGKSADLINNTMFLVKNLSNKNTVTSSENINKNQSDQQIPLEKQSGENSFQIKNTDKQMNTSFSFGAKKKPISRSEFFRQIKESINVRRSKYISAQELKNSFKPSKLQQLQEIRLKRQERRKKDAMYELGEVDDEDAENVIQNLQNEVAKNEKISKQDLRRLLRQEEGLEELDEYDDQEDKKKKKPEKNQQKKPYINEQQNQKVQQKTQKEASKAGEIQQPIQKEQKQSVSEKQQKHADDMIDEYEDLGNQQQQMEQQEDLDYENQQYQGENQQGEEQENQQQGSNDGDQNDQEQGQEQEEIEAEYKSQEKAKDSQMRKQLQQEGIIMPGLNHKNNKKKLNFTEDDDNHIDASKYLIPSSINPEESKPIENLKQEKKQTLINPQDTLQFKEFKKLRKIAVVIQEKKKKRDEQLKRAKQFFQQQAELGSDNEENDDNVKAINKKDDSQQEDGEQLDQQLEELIDNAVDLNEEDEDLAFRKYMQDVKEKDREELQRILRGDFRRHNQDMPQLQQMQEDEKNRYERMQKMMEWMRRRQDDQKGLYADDSEDEDDERNFYYDYNGNRKRINRKQKIINMEVNEESQQENEQQVEQKLRYFLMDTISPAKNQSYLTQPTELLTQLPQVFKNNNKPFNKHFVKFDLDFKKKETPKKQTTVITQQSKKGNNFSGSLLNLGSTNGQGNGLAIPKMKKASSHMSDQLNKNKVQKPMSGLISQNKLNAIFSRFAKPTKK